jgi:hypothetical protein
MLHVRAGGVTMPVFAAVPAPWNLICQLLLLGIWVLLVGGFSLNRYDDERAGRVPKSMEWPQSALLIGLAAIVWAMAARPTPLATLGALVCAGMACGFVGDLFMANVFQQKSHVLFGMAAFGIGHVLYILAFRELAVYFALHDLGRYTLAVLITWAAALSLWFALVRKPGGGAMQYAALAYALFLASMAGFALGLALQNRTFLGLAVGAILFLLSDTLIAARLFARRVFLYLGDAIWATYILAQALIVLVVPLALTLE